MGSKVAFYLQEHLSGEVITSPDARRYFSTDGSIFAMTPALVVYPKNENDVRKTARFTWQLAERGRIIPITPRGAGTDQGGAAITNGIILAFTAHMNRLLEFDDKSGVAVTEAGAGYGKLQQTLHTHGRFLPPYPASLEYSTIGGAVANNTSGVRGVKYGSTRDFVRSLRVVLANGEVIETGRLSKRDLNKKLGLSTFEGEIYRALDSLLEENYQLLEKLDLPVTKNTAGYGLQYIKAKDGSFDLTPLFVGAQATLGIITEIALDTETYNQATTMVVGYFDDNEKAAQAVLELRNLSEIPCAIEMVDEHFLTLVDSINPNLLKGVIEKPFPKIVLLVEFDDPSERIQKRLAKKANKIMEHLATNHMVETDPAIQEELWKIRAAAATIVTHNEGNARALPFIEDGIVPPEKFREYLDGIHQLFARHRLPAAVWGHAGDANLHMQPLLDLGQVGDRQKVFKMLDEYYHLVISLGGSTSGEHNDGRLRGAYLERLYGTEVYQLFQKVKQIFDPYGTLNPGVKVNVSVDALKPLLRSSYSVEHLYDHLPRS
ncbi:MAG TPA: FAD-binding oxidoreductase [Candidatus Saccharimonadales bacterium]|nr:FAD-binding oxidoreductase [Candidatus Saccharimonadales bacterium]